MLGFFRCFPGIGFISLQLFEKIDFEEFEQEIAGDKIDEADKESQRENQQGLGGEFVIDDIVDEAGREAEAMMDAHQLCQCQR